MQTISAEKFILNALDILDRLVRRGECALIERDGVIVAKIVPTKRTMTAQQALEGLSCPLTPDEANSWLSDCSEAFR